MQNCKHYYIKQYGVTEAKCNIKDRNFLVIGKIESISLSVIKNQKSVNIYTYRGKSDVHIIEFRNAVRAGNKKIWGDNLVYKIKKPFPSNFIRKQQKHQNVSQERVWVTKLGHSAPIPQFIFADPLFPYNSISSIECGNSYGEGYDKLSEFKQNSFVCSEKSLQGMVQERDMLKREKIRLNKEIEDLKRKTLKGKQHYPFKWLFSTLVTRSFIFQSN